MQDGKGSISLPEGETHHINVTVRDAQPNQEGWVYFVIPKAGFDSLRGNNVWLSCQVSCLLSLWGDGRFKGTYL